jgi:hypothetical protein
MPERPAVINSCVYRRKMRQIFHRRDASSRDEFPTPRTPADDFFGLIGLLGRGLCRRTLCR